MPVSSDRDRFLKSRYVASRRAQPRGRGAWKFLATATVFQDGQRFMAFPLKDNSSSIFDTFAEAERWLWQHGV